MESAAKPDSAFPMNAASHTKLIGRVLMLALFALPIVEVASILAVAAHEILGHGLSAVLLGGTFSGFVLKWDGMGWAFASMPPNAPLSHHVLYLASGVLTTTLLGALLLALALRQRRRADIRLALLILSFLCLMDGIPYLLWNAYHAVPPGDIGRILALLRSQSVSHAALAQLGLFGLGAVLFAVTTFYFCTALFMTMEELILDGGQFTGWSRPLALLVFLVVPGSVQWWLFDWNQLVPGIGRLPGFVGTLSFVVTGALLLWYRPGNRHEESTRSITWHHVIISCVCLAAAIAPLILWFQDGIHWD